MPDPEQQHEISQLLDEARERLKDAIETDSKIQLADSIECLIEVLDRMNPKP